MAEAQDRPLAGKDVVMCVTGGIACYKAADLVSKLVQAGAGVSVAMTDAAQRFVAPLTFQALSMRQVYTSLWQPGEAYRSTHIALAEQADLMIVAPATADIIAKMAAGLADDLVSTLALSAGDACPVLIAPAMNRRMWHAEPTRENVARLTARGVHVVGPAEGHLACGDVGVGRMVEPAHIVARAVELLSR